MTKRTKDLTSERGKDYGHPRDHFAATQAVYSEWLRRRYGARASGSPRLEHERAVWHAVYMICDKLVRAATSPTKKDHWDDIQGYARTAKMVLELED